MKVDFLKQRQQLKNITFSFWWCFGVGNVFLTHKLCWCWCITLWTKCTHLIIATYSIMCHVSTQIVVSNWSMNMTMSSISKQPSQSPDLNLVEHFLRCNRLKNWQHEQIAADILIATMWCNHVTIDQNLKAIFTAPCEIHAKSK